MPVTAIQNEDEKALKFFRICVLSIAAIETVVGALSVTFSLGIFTYYLIAANEGDSFKSDFFFEQIIETDKPISAKTFSKIAVFMFVYSIIHFLASVSLYRGAKTFSLEKCRWSIILHICLWAIGIIVLIAPLTEKITLWLYVIVFSLKVVEVALIKRFMDELYLQGFCE